MHFLICHNHVQTKIGHFYSAVAICFLIKFKTKKLWVLIYYDMHIFVAWRRMWWPIIHLYIRSMDFMHTVVRQSIFPVTPMLVTLLLYTSKAGKVKAWSICHRTPSPNIFAYCMLFLLQMCRKKHLIHLLKFHLMNIGTIFTTINNSISLKMILGDR